MSELKELTALCKKVILSNADMMRLLRETTSLMKEQNEKFIDAIDSAKLLNSKTPRIMQKLRESGLLKPQIDFYFHEKRFWYRRTRLVEIKNDIIAGRITSKELKA